MKRDGAGIMEREGLLNARGTHEHTCSVTKLKYLTTQQVEDNIHD